MWTHDAQLVDKPLLYTTSRTTPLQDVPHIAVGCEYEIQTNIAQGRQFPQSPALITVISYIYPHPHIAIEPSTQHRLSHITTSQRYGASS